LIVNINHPRIRKVNRMKIIGEEKIITKIMIELTAEEAELLSIFLGGFSKTYVRKMNWVKDNDKTNTVIEDMFNILFNKLAEGETLDEVSR
jgi:hypothetical protein